MLMPKIKSFEQGLMLFEREAVLSLKDRAPLVRAEISKQTLAQLETIFPYVTEPKIR